ncbi:MAG: hypoxanthine phosphoribosyltransferase [Candidatus Gastranaerophilales bacterium]|nr:hypoxanthine phosphoribosyltransferase [Candidatus Gastranaerophilales bacterium]MCM1073915.1 hypoxanthine phosphoribosyltransferase [Bacteroides sp.]
MIKESDLKVLFNAENIQKEIHKLGELLNNTYKDEEVYLICVLKGSVMFMTDLAKHLKMPVKMEFIRLSSYGSGFTTSGKVNAVDISLPDLNGKNVLIIEDIIDTGHTAKFLVDFINLNFKVKDLKFCSLLDKRVKREVDIDADYYCFEVDDKFLVGYGLDYDGYYRNIPYIGYVEV